MNAVDASVGLVTPAALDRDVPEHQLAPGHIFVIALPHLLAVGGLFYHSWQSFFGFVVAHYFFALSGSLGYHRLFSHRSFKPRPWLRNVFATLATMTMQGGPVFWATVHRWHHAYTERRGDPHSSRKGFFFSHVGWIFYQYPNGFVLEEARKQTRDLEQLPYIAFLQKYAFRLNFLLMLLAYLAFRHYGRVDLFFWLFPMRIVSVWHSTWLTNSYVHLAGDWLGRTDGGGRLANILNSVLIALIIPGEGPHHDHHEHPSRLTYEGAWKTVDVGYWILTGMKRLGWVEFRTQDR